jgi:hypothetical protein
MFFSATRILTRSIAAMKPVRRPSGARVRVFMLAALAGAAAACGGDAKGPVVPPAHVEAVIIDRSSVLVELMDSARVTASVRMSDGTLSTRHVLWACTRSDLVESCGPRIVPRDTGSYRLIATLDGVADTVDVRIYEQGMRDVVILDPPTGQPYWILQGVPVLLQLRITDSLNVNRMDRPLRWSSSDTSVAVVRDTVWWNWNASQWWPAGRLLTRAPGVTRLTLTVGGQQAAIDVVVRPRATACAANEALSLDLAVGELHRWRGSDPSLPACVQYRHDRDAGRRYLMLAERLPVASSSQAAGRRGVFLSGAPPAADSLVLQVYTPLTTPAQLLAARVAFAAQAPSLNAATTAEWHVRGHVLRESPPQRQRAAREVRRGAQAATPSQHALVLGGSTPLAVDDTVVIPRLASVPHGATYSGEAPPSDRAVVRHVGANLVFAEHLEMFDSRLRRANGQPGQPIPATEYARIDAAYGPGQSQLDQLFGPSPTDSTLGLPSGRELVVNTILPTGVWGTAAGDMAIVDYWSGSTGGSAGTLQDPVVVANQLIVHEMAHVRHFLHRPAEPLLLWSLEGIARFAEHLAFAAHVLGGEQPSRSGNALVGNLGYPTQPDHRSHIEMPTPAGLGTNFLGGYSGAGYVFDYLADHVAAAGGDGLLAVRDVLLNLHDRAAADAAVLRGLGQPMSLDELITRARLALVLDNVPTTAALPGWTQYLQFDVRSSRPWVPSWPNAIPGAPLAVVRQIGEGLVYGVWIDGERATADQDLIIDITRGEQSVFSIVRIQ